MELTIRTPYKTIYKKFKDFSRLVTKTNEGILLVQNNMPAALHILPPGYLKVKLLKNDEGLPENLMHTGGFISIHPDNSCEINLIEGFDKNEIQANKLTKSDFSEEPDEKGFV